MADRDVQNKLPEDLLDEEEVKKLVENCKNQRDKVIRGLKSDKTAEVYMENWKTFYNFVKPQMTFKGLTPSEVAGINIGQDRNRWMGLIKLSTQNNM